MIIQKNRTSGILSINVSQILFVVFLIYSTWGFLFLYTAYDYISAHILTFLASCIVAHIAIPDARISLSNRIDRQQSNLYTCIGIALLSIYLLLILTNVPSDYFSLSKAARYAALDNLTYLKPIFYTSIMMIILTSLGEYSAVQFRWSIGALLVALVWSWADANREFIVVISFGVVVISSKYRHMPVLLSGTTKSILAIVAGLLFMGFFKNVYTLIWFGTTYEGGVFSITELTNWAKWTYLYIDSAADLSYVQRNDLAFALEAIYSPFSSVTSATGVFYTDILLRDDIGLTVGYSGILWLYGISGYSSLVLGPIVVFLLISLISKNKSLAATIVLLGIILLSYRLMRSEWVLALKHLLWFYLYPSLLCVAAVYLITPKTRITNNEYITTRRSYPL